MHRLILSIVVLASCMLIAIMVRRSSGLSVEGAYLLSSPQRAVAHNGDSPLVSPPPSLRVTEKPVPTKSTVLDAAETETPILRALTKVKVTASTHPTIVSAMPALWVRIARKGGRDMAIWLQKDKVFDDGRIGWIKTVQLAPGTYSAEPVGFGLVSQFVVEASELTVDLGLCPGIAETKIWVVEEGEPVSASSDWHIHPLPMAYWSGDGRINHPDASKLVVKKGEDGAFSVVSGAGELRVDVINRFWAKESFHFAVTPGPQEVLCTLRNSERLAVAYLRVMEHSECIRMTFAEITALRVFNGEGDVVEPWRIGGVSNDSFEVSGYGDSGHNIDAGYDNAIMSLGAEAGGSIALPGYPVIRIVLPEVGTYSLEYAGVRKEFAAELEAAGVQEI